MATPVIVSATRTAVGTLGGALAQLPATKLGAIAVRDAVSRAKLDPTQVEEVILGHVLPAGLGLNPSRVSALEAGLPKEVSTYGVNKACGSGLKAVALAAQAIQLDQADVIVAGGMESMSGAPYLLKKARFAVCMGHDEILDSIAPLSSDDPKFQEGAAKALGIYWRDQIDVPIIQWLHRIAYNQHYWKNWPTAANPAMGTNGAFWAHTGMLVITSLQPTGAQ